jgi:hypothetical protein
MTPVSICLAAVFAAWFALSVAAHLRSKVRERFPRLEALGLVPHWNFFAPRPGVHDIHLLFRDVAPDGSTGGLAYVPMIGPRRWYHVLWHPDKYRSKVVSDISASIQAVCREAHESESDPRVVMLTQSYLLALHLAMRMPREEPAQARQFVLARRRALDEEAEQQIVFLSEYHPFAAAGAKQAA